MPSYIENPSRVIKLFKWIFKEYNCEDKIICYMFLSVIQISSMNTNSHVFKQFTTKHCILGQNCEWNNTTGIVGAAPFGIPCNIKITGIFSWKNNVCLLSKIWDAQVVHYWYKLKYLLLQIAHQFYLKLLVLKVHCKSEDIPGITSSHLISKIRKAPTILAL